MVLSKSCRASTESPSSNVRKRKALLDDQVLESPPGEGQPWDKLIGTAVASTDLTHHNKRFRCAPTDPTTSINGSTLVGWSSQLEEAPVTRLVLAQAYYVEPVTELQATRSIDSPSSTSMDMDLAQTTGAPFGSDLLDNRFGIYLAHILHFSTVIFRTKASSILP